MKVIQVFLYCMHCYVYWVFWSSDRVVYFIHIGYTNVFRPSTTGTIPLTTQVLRAATTKWHETSQTINRNVQSIIFVLLLCDGIKFYLFIYIHYLMRVKHIYGFQLLASVNP